MVLKVLSMSTAGVCLITSREDMQLSGQQLIEEAISDNSWMRYCQLW